MEQTVKMNHLLVLSEQLYKRISESENKTPYAFNLLDLAGVNEPFTSLILAHITAVPLKWASRSLKQLKHSLLEEVFHVRRFESVILQPINGLLYEQKQICVRTIG